jgi:DNA-binding transcriptional LysR family regulator
VADIQDRVHGLRQSSQNLRKGRGAVIRVAALPSLGLGAIPQAVARFLKRRPSVTFDLQTTHHDEMVRRLYERETDIVVGFDVPRSAAMAHRSLGRSELVVMYDERMLSKADNKVTLAELAGKPFISPVQSGPIGQLLSAELNRLEVALDEVVSARTFYIAAALVRAGVGLTVVDRFTAQATVGPGIGFRAIRPSLTFDVYAAYLENRPPSALAGEFLDELSRAISHS